LYRFVDQARGLQQLGFTHQDLRGTSLQKTGEINALIGLPWEEAKRLVEAAKAGATVSAKQRRLELPLNGEQVIAGFNEIVRVLTKAHPQVYDEFVRRFAEHLGAGTDAICTARET
jgi:hypothetical protein